MEIAQDKSLRFYDQNGHLIVERTIITKASVNEYLGKEIPNHEALGLKPERSYWLLRDPKELKKALSTFAGVQLLIKHIPVNSDEPHNNLTIGSIGTELEMVGDDVYSSLRVFDQKGIDFIESGKLRALSAGYSYRADMTKGEYNGIPYDGVMRDIHGNHVAIVEKGRIGKDSIISDELPKQLENKMKLKEGAYALIAAAIKKGFAMDGEVGKEAVEEVVKVVKDSLPDDDDKPKGEDEDKEKEPKAIDSDTENGKKESTDKQEGIKDNKPAMDAETIHANAVKSVTNLFNAREKVKPLVGLIACDSAESTYAEALKAKGINIQGVHPSAYEPMVDMLLSNSQSKPNIALDSAYDFESDELTARFK